MKISHLPVQGDHCKTDSPVQPQLDFSEAVKGKTLLLRCLHVNSLGWIHFELYYKSCCRSLSEFMAPVYELSNA